MSIVKPGNHIVIGEDIEQCSVLIVDEVLKQNLVCRVQTPNILYSNQKVYLPGIKNKLSDVTKHTIDDLSFAKYAKINIIFTSYVCNSNTIMKYIKFSIMIVKTTHTLY